MYYKASGGFEGTHYMPRRDPCVKKYKKARKSMHDFFLFEYLFLTAVYK